MSNYPDIGPEDITLQPQDLLVFDGKKWVPAGNLYVVLGDIEYECRPVIGLRHSLEAATQCCRDHLYFEPGGNYAFDRHYIEEWPVGGDNTKPVRTWVWEQGRLTEIPKLEDLK